MFFFSISKNKSSIIFNISNYFTDVQEDSNSKNICEIINNDIEERLTSIKKNRESAVKNLQKQGNKMLSRSAKKLEAVIVGTTVKIPVPEVDRARGAPQNILAVVTEVSDGFYKLATTSGFIKQKFVRTEFHPCKENLLSLEEISKKLSETNTELSVRQAAATENSIFGTQGFNKCSCKSGCSTNKCSCFKAGKICTSKCHGSLSCNNKEDK